MSTVTIPDLSERSAASESRWNFVTVFALLSLVLIWVVKMHSTWAAWGNLSVDSGHEMYVPVLLSEGKQLYRDVWFMYGPLAPYFNSYLFRIFGIYLNVLYWAGSISALCSAVFLYLIGRRLSSELLGWTAGAVLLLESFEPSLFCFPLPYSFAAVYGCLIGSIFLWAAISASTSTSKVWMFVASSLAGISVLLKPEFGLAAYATLFPLILIRGYSQRSWKSIIQDVSLALPGIALIVGVILWMVSIRGVEFITQENIVSWPSSFFMKNYGKLWLEANGFTLSASAFLGALNRTVPIALLALVVYLLLWWKRSAARSVTVKVALALVTCFFLWGNYFYGVPFHLALEKMLTGIFFPQDMVLYVIIATGIAWWYFLRPAGAIAGRNPGLPLLLTFSSALAFRILMRMQPSEYPIYYNGPVVLSFLLLACMLVPQTGRSRSFILSGRLLICLGCLFGVAMYSSDLEHGARNYVPLVTDRGTVRASRFQVENYKAAIQFMKEKAALGESVLSVPEDTSLYFLSGTYCPTRVYLFVPGTLAPGKMTDELIREIDQKPVRYLIWSNRTFSEFGVPFFGKDFDKELGDYLRSRYRSVGPLMQNSGPCCDWSAYVWERKSDAELK